MNEERILCRTSPKKEGQHAVMFFLSLEESEWNFSGQNHIYFDRLSKFLLLTFYVCLYSTRGANEYMEKEKKIKRKLNNRIHVNEIQWWTVKIYT